MKEISDYTGSWEEESPGSERDLRESPAIPSKCLSKPDLPSSSGKSRVTMDFRSTTELFKTDYKVRSTVHIENDKLNKG